MAPLEPDMRSPFASTGAVVTRRSFLAAAAGLATTGVVGVRSVEAWAAAVPRQLVAAPPVLPRDTWGSDLAPTATIPAEDVRFLLVHHTLSPGNDYDEDDVVGLLRGIYGYHTGPEKLWPDIAYNFMVDRFGRVFEARAGSIAGPVEGSATGGNQGFSQLCCFLGDHSTEPPTDAAQTSMIWLLAWLAERYSISLEPGARTSFTSRGSNRWPAGTTVEASTIAGHRDMSQTACPGDACYSLLDSGFRPAALALAAPAVVDTTTTEPTTTTTATSTPVEATPSSAPATASTTTVVAESGTATNGSGVATVDEAAAVTPNAGTAADHRPSTELYGTLGIGAAAAVAGIVGLRRRVLERQRPEPWQRGEDPPPNQG